MFMIRCGVVVLFDCMIGVVVVICFVVMVGLICMM